MLSWPIAVQNIETWQADSSTGNTPMAKRNSIPMATLFSSPHPLDFNMLVIFSMKNVKQGPKLELTYLYACWIMHTCKIALSKYQNRMPKMAEKAFNMWRSGTQYVAMVTELLSLY